MIKDINDFITIRREKNGQIEITFDHPDNKKNIYKFLYEFGYRSGKVDNKLIYFIRKDSKLTISSLNEIKSTFIDYLEDFEFKNIPNDVQKPYVTNCFHIQKPIKANGLCKYLNENLTNSETLQLKLQTNAGYKYKNEIDNLLLKFNEWGVNKTTIDTLGDFKKGNILYYKKIESNKYLIFNNCYSSDKNKQCFDCKVASFVNENDIGKKKPTDLQTIRINFEIDRDFELISNYLI